MANSIKAQIAVSTKPPSRRVIDACMVAALIPRRIELIIPMTITTQVKIIRDKAVTRSVWYFSVGSFIKKQTLTPE